MALNNTIVKDSNNVSCMDDTNHALKVNVVTSSGVGGSVTVADGADVCEGTTTDAAVSTDTTGTVSGKLRGLVKLLASVISLGRLLVDGSGVTQPVSGAITANGPTASGAALTAAPLTAGGLAKTALPTAVADAQVVNSTHDKFGRQIVIPQVPRDLVGTQTTTISASTSETTVVTAIASVFADLVLVIVANTSATAVRVDFRDTTGGSVVFSVEVPATQNAGFAPPIPIPQTTVNTNWTAQSSASVTDLRIFCQFVKNR